MNLIKDKVFDDQIERMKIKNQRILERFQASEEDRIRAESNGSTINKNQNVQIRLKKEDNSRQRKKSNPPALRPKSYHEVSMFQNETGYTAYNQFNKLRKQGKVNRQNKEINDEVAYQDYFHFQQTHCSKTNNSHQNRSTYQNNSHFNPDDSYDNKQSFRNYQRSTSQKLSRNSHRFNQNSYQNANVFIASTEQSVYKLDNNKIHSTDSHAKFHHICAKNQTKYKLNNNINNEYISIDDRKQTNKSQSFQKTILDDEYIDDTLEDLEKYRLKVDMYDFTVIDPESPNPILAMPLTPWSNDTILTESDVLKCEESSIDLLNTANERARDYLNLVNQSNIEDLSNMSMREDHIRQSVTQK